MGKVKRLDEETNMGGRRERQRGEKAIYEQPADILDACFIFFIAVLFTIILVLWQDKTKNERRRTKTNIN